MKRAAAGFLAIVVVAFFWSAPGGAAAALQAPAASAAPVCAKTWIGHEAEIEQYMRTAPIEKVEELPIGVTKPQRAFFAPGGLVASAAWKPLPPRMQGGFFESYQAEVAAYAMDRLLDMHMVPPVVVRKMDGKVGALIFWVNGTKTWDIKNPIEGPDKLAWAHEVAKMKMFDQLIGNIDRNEGNLLVDGDYHLILIDHSRAFIPSKDLSRIAKLGRLDKTLWNKMLALDEDSLKSAIGEWYGKREIGGILARRDEMKKEVATRLAHGSERAVFLADSVGGTD
ncbi:MAG TPA: hypothetical protein VFX12_04890 [Vicinamibacterales bacterium]|nr:hypothetical protein [Vicinamibacterales bacterium]